jgi:hypothetical protein
MLIAAHLLPLRFLALVGGWAAIWSGHPTVARWLQQTKLQYLDAPNKPQPQTQPQTPTLPFLPPTLTTNPLTLLTSDIRLDTSPETREVEIFELQHQSPSTHEWEPWFFAPSPYDPLSAARIAGDRPRGTRFFEDVLPPRGWEWSEKKWALDLWSREWVEERIITGVEVETEGERWVYDMWNEREAGRGGGAGGGGDGQDGGGEGSGGGGVGGQQQQQQGRVTPGVSWEEGEEGMGRRGSWRRRRWVRMVKRRKVTTSG